MRFCAILYVLAALGRSLLSLAVACVNLIVEFNKIQFTNITTSMIDCR